MTTELEHQLIQELRAVARELPVPNLPHLDLDARPPRSHPWLPALVAAVIATIVAGALLLGPDGNGHREAPPAVPRRVSTEPPTIPYVEHGRLYLGGKLQPGSWGGLMNAGQAWAGTRASGVSVWGVGARITVPDATGYPQFSPDGRLAVHQWDDGTLHAYDTADPATPVATLDKPASSVAGALPFELRGVTNDGLVVLQNLTESRLWNLRTGQVLDLAQTAPDQRALPTAVGGIIWTDGEGGPAYLADLDATGHLSHRRPVPGDDTIPNEDDSWAVLPTDSRALGQIGVYETLGVLDLAGGTRKVVVPPRPWLFTDVTWESPDTFLSHVIDRQRHTRTARCDVVVGRCALVAIR